MLQIDGNKNTILFNQGDLRQNTIHVICFHLCKMAEKAHLEI